jgi:hypothetical protein
MVDFLDSPGKSKPKGKKRKKSRSTASESESDAYVNPNLSQSENSSDEHEPFQEYLKQDVAELGNPVVGNSKKPTGLSGNKSRPPPASASVSQPTPTPALPDGHGAAVRRQVAAVCAMCGNAHQGTCGMTERSENLVHYRQVLFTNETGEPFEERVGLINWIRASITSDPVTLISGMPLRSLITP